MASFLTWEIEDKKKELETLKLELENERREIARLKEVEEHQGKEIEYLNELLKEVQEEKDTLVNNLEKSKNGTSFQTMIVVNLIQLLSADCTVLVLRVNQLEEENEQQANRYAELYEHLSRGSHLYS